MRATVDRIWDRKIKYFESAIRDAHAQGLIVAPDPAAKARALFACYHGTLAQARIQNDVELIRDFNCQFYRRLVKYKSTETGKNSTL